jgi:hypothetical protein
MTKAAPAASALGLAALLLLSVPPAAAHGAAPPADYLARLLSDYSDDWFGVADGHNVIALDGYTQWNESLGGDVVVLRLVLDGGWARTSAATGTPELAEHVTFQAKGVDKEYAIRTEDNQAFEAELGFKAVRGPFPQLTADGTQDGTRFFVEGLAPFADLGIQAGDALSGFFVQGEAGDGEGDAMPQYDLAPGGAVPAASDDVHSDVGSWAVPGTDRYVKSTLGAVPGPVPRSGDLAVGVSFANAFNESQSVMAMAYAGDGLLAGFGGAPSTNVSMGMLDLAALKSGSLSLHVARASPAPAASNSSAATTAAQPHPHGNATAATAKGTVRLVVTSSLGGHQVVDLTLDVEQPPAPAMNETAGHEHGSAEAKGSPSPAVPALALAVAAVAIALRRRD